MAQHTLIDRPAAAGDGNIAVGQRRRVGGIGQVYRILEIVDAVTVLIHAEQTDEDLPYPIADALLDPFASEPAAPDMARFEKLVGQFRSIGPDGPTYEVVSITDSTCARIWIIPEDDDEDYDIEDILLDPISND